MGRWKNMVYSYNRIWVSGKKKWVLKALGPNPWGVCKARCQVKGTVIPVPDCMSLFSVAKTNTRTTQQLEEERAYLAYVHIHVHSITKGRWNTNSSRNCSKDMEAWLFTLPCLAYFLIHPRNTCQRWYHAQWPGPSHINYSSRKCSTILSTGQSDEGIFFKWGFLSSHDSSCVNLKESQPWHWHSVKSKIMEEEKISN